MYALSYDLNSSFSKFFKGSAARENLPFLHGLFIPIRTEVHAVASYFLKRKTLLSCLLLRNPYFYILHLKLT
jgi:hypothetical protein